MCIFLICKMWTASRMLSWNIQVWKVRGFNANTTVENLPSHRCLVGRQTQIRVQNVNTRRPKYMHRPTTIWTERNSLDYSDLSDCRIQHDTHWQKEKKKRSCLSDRKRKKEEKMGPCQLDGRDTYTTPFSTCIYHWIVDRQTAALFIHANGNETTHMHITLIP